MWRVLFDMMRAEFVDGLVLQGADHKELVKRLWDSAHWDDSKDVEEYMERVAERTQVQTGQAISYLTAQDFIEELKRVGIITVLESVPLQ